MTTVRIDLRRDAGLDDLAHATGRLEWTPTRRRSVDLADEQQALVLPEGFTAALVDGVATVHVAPTGPGWCWHVVELTRAGRERWVAVPASPSTREYADLVDVDPATLDPAAEPEAAWTVELEQLRDQVEQLGAGTGGGGGGGGGGLPDTAAADEGDRLILVGPDKTPQWREDRSGEPTLIVAGDDLNEVTTSGRYMLDLSDAEEGEFVKNTPQLVQRGLLIVDAYDYDNGYYGSGVAVTQTFQLGAQLFERTTQIPEGGNGEPVWSEWGNATEDRIDDLNDDVTEDIASVRADQRGYLPRSLVTANGQVYQGVLQGSLGAYPITLDGISTWILDSCEPGALVIVQSGIHDLYVRTGVENLNIKGAGPALSTWTSGPAHLRVGANMVTLVEPWDAGDPADVDETYIGGIEPLFPVGTIPQVDSQETAAGHYSLRPDTDALVDDGPAVMLAYGDLNGNTGPTDVLAIDLESGELLDQLFPAWDTESIDHWRRWSTYTPGYEQVQEDWRYVFAGSSDPRGNGQASVMTNWPEGGNNFHRIPVGTSADESDGAAHDGYTEANRLVHVWDCVVVNGRVFLAATRLVTAAERAAANYPAEGDSSVVVVWEGELDPENPESVEWSETVTDVPPTVNGYAYSRSFFCDGAFLYLRSWTPVEGKEDKTRFWRYSLLNGFSGSTYSDALANFEAYLTMFDEATLALYGITRPHEDEWGWAHRAGETTYYGDSMGLVGGTINDVYRWSQYGVGWSFSGQFPVPVVKSNARTGMIGPNDDGHGYPTGYGPAAGESVGVWEGQNTVEVSPLIRSGLTIQTQDPTTRATTLVDIVPNWTAHYGGGFGEGGGDVTVAEYRNLNNSSHVTRLMCNSESVYRSGFWQEPQPGMLAG